MEYQYRTNLVQPS